MAPLRRSLWTTSILLVSVSTLSPSALSQARQTQEAGQAPVATLKVGDQAPAFQPGTWLKGEPVAALAKGKIYVIEFWATWCGPCKASMPHISKLAKQYAGKIEFLGVDVMEEGAFEDVEKKVLEFMQGEGRAMDYLVCRDTAAGAMQTTWLTAAGQHGIPATFVVDATGRLVWIGHPQRMDPVLEKVLDGTFDPFAEERAAAAYREAEKAVSDALQAKDWPKALKLARALKPADKIAETWKGFFLFQANLHGDDKAAEATFDLAVKEDERGVIDTYAGLVVREQGLSKAWYSRAALFLNKRAKEDPSTYSLLAKAQFQAGDAKGAVESQLEALADLRARIPRILEDHPDAGKQLEAFVAREEAELKKYEAAAKEQDRTHHAR